MNENSALGVGNAVSISRVIRESDIEMFAELSRDRNAVHFDDAFASKTIFGQRVAHGMIGASLISGALTELMGHGNIWLSADIRFENPVYIADEITASLTVASIDRRGLAEIEVAIENQSGELVVTGKVRSMRFVRS